MFDITWEASWYDLLIGVIVIFLIWLFLVILKKRRRDDTLDLAQIQKRWQEIEVLINKDSEAMWRVAIIDADKLLDFVLKGKVFPGETMGQRLKVACYKYPKLRQVWGAHKLRNNIVHEAHVKLSQGQAKKAIRSFHAALSELKAL